MKLIDIAFKDMTQAFRSVFALVFMFALPLLVTGMFYFMLGSMKTDDGGYKPPRTKIVVVNLDEGSPQFQSGMAGMPADMQADSLGGLVVTALQDENLADLLEVSLSEDAAAARQMVDRQEAGVAIVLPADFSASFADTDGVTSIELYQDPTLTLGPAIVRSILGQFVDGFSGVKIAVNTTLQQADAGLVGYAEIGSIVQGYTAAALPQEGTASHALLEVHSTDAVDDESKNQMAVMIGGIMAGMMIFYAFFTGASTAQSILREEESGTMPRLFTTPTAQATILGGKFLAVFLTVLVQVIVLVIAARLLFQIEWGMLLPLSLTLTGLVVTASAFGICVNAWMKSTKQGGVVYGGLLTVTGMIGMIDVFTGNPGGASRFGNLPLLMPQGWVERGLLQTMQGATVGQILPYLTLMFVGSVVLFAIGVWRFQKRYA
ncbi:MAG: ABC transporter permease [Chloroflexota bacterium]